MEFAGLLKQSLVDYPGQIAAVLFTRGCNFACPYCHNPHLIPSRRREREKGHSQTKAGKSGADKPRDNQSPDCQPLNLETVLTFLSERNTFLDAVVITGGEPTLHPELPAALSHIKNLGYLVKLDTNGTNPEMLERLLGKNLLDYVALDVKAPLDYKKYARAAGRLSKEDFFHIRTSINLLQNSPTRVEFRTTVVPALHSPEDIVAIARCLQGCELFTLQQFNPACTLDPAYGQVVPYNRQEMQELADKCSPYVQNVRVINL